MSQIFKPELLCPAGSPEKLRYAIEYGADAVYAGVPIFSLRARENEFDWDKLDESVKFCHERGKKIYLTVNIFARNMKINLFKKQVDRLAQLKPDGLIMSDPGLIAEVKERHPEIPIHLSVQANCMNWRSVKFWQSVGIERVILSRELRLEEIKTIKDQVPDMELEAFVHGSICIAYSGRCLLSRYMSYRDANQGVCDNSCRYPMKIFGESKDAPDMNFYLEDARNPNELYRIDEDEEGTYIMNAKDLRLIEYLRELRDAGVCSFKIEGRTKSIFYLSIVTSAYRHAIDDMAANRDLDPNLIRELDLISKRGYHSGFLVDTNSQAEVYSQPDSQVVSSGYVGLVRDQLAASTPTYHVEVKGSLRAGEEYEVMSPQGLKRLRILTMKNAKGETIERSHSGIGVITIETSAPIEPFALLRKTPENLAITAPQFIRTEQSRAQTTAALLKHPLTHRKGEDGDTPSEP